MICIDKKRDFFSDSLQSPENIIISSFYLQRKYLKGFCEIANYWHIN